MPDIVWDDAAGVDVALEYLAEAAKRADTLLDSGSRRVVEPDDGRADLHRLIHHLTDLFGEHLAERAAKHGKIVGEDEDRSTVDLAVARDDAVGQKLLFLHPEGVVAVGAELVELVEGVVVEEVVDTLAGGHLPLIVLFGNAVFTAALAGFFAFCPQLLDAVVHRHRRPPVIATSDSDGRKKGSATGCGSIQA